MADQPGRCGRVLAAHGSTWLARARRGPGWCVIVVAARQPEDAARVGVDDEGDVDHPGPGRDVGEVGNPQPVRGQRVELAGRPGRAARTAAGSAMVVRIGRPRAHAGQPVLRASAVPRCSEPTGDAFAVQRQPDLAGAVDAVVLRVHPRDLDRQLPRRAAAAGGGWLGARRRRSRWTGRSVQPMLGELRADRLDTPSLPAARCGAGVLVDEPHERRGGRSSSAAKKAEAALRISLARRSSAFSRRSRLISADSSLVVARPLTRRRPRPGGTHLRTVSGGADPELLRDRVHRRPLRLVVRRYLSDHPHRPLPQLRRIGRLGPTCHDQISSDDQVSGHAGAVQTRESSSLSMVALRDPCAVTAPFDRAIGLRVLPRASRWTWPAPWGRRGENLADSGPTATGRSPPLEVLARSSSDFCIMFLPAREQRELQR